MKIATSIAAAAVLLPTAVQAACQDLQFIEYGIPTLAGYPKYVVVKNNGAEDVTIGGDSTCQMSLIANGNGFSIANMLLENSPATIKADGTLAVCNIDTQPKCQCDVKAGGLSMTGNDYIDIHVTGADGSVVDSYGNATSPKYWSQRGKILQGVDDVETDYLAQTPFMCGGDATDPGDLDDDFTNIHLLTGSDSEFVDRGTLKVKGVITADLRAHGSHSGFYIQATKAERQVDRNNTAAILVQVVNGEIGDKVQEGNSVELEYAKLVKAQYDNRLEVVADNIKVTCSDPQVKQVNGLEYCEEIEIPVLTVPLEDASERFLNKYMVTTVNDDLEMRISDTFFLSMYGDLKLVHGTTDGRQIYPLQRSETGGKDDLFGKKKELQKAELYIKSPVKKGRSDPASLFPEFKDSVTDAERKILHVGMPVPATVFQGTGVMSYEYSKWGVVPSVRGLALIQEELLKLKDIRQDRQSPEDLPVADLPSGLVRLGSLNVENYFISCVGSNDDNCRGAKTAEHLAMQKVKIYETVKRANATVFGLQEMENDDDQAALSTFVSELNEVIGDEHLSYRYVDAGKVGTDVIKTAIIYQPAFVEPVGEPVVKSFTFSGHRPAVAQTFALRNSATSNFTMVSVHMKSKSPNMYIDGAKINCGKCSSSSIDDRCKVDAVGGCDEEGGEGNFAIARKVGITELRDWAAELGKTNSEGRIMVVGDYNAYRYEQGMVAMREGENGFEDVAAEKIGLAASSYTYDGLFGTLDYLMASKAMFELCEDVLEWGTNSLESDKIVYSGEGAAETVYRSSDHDPAVVNVQLLAGQTDQPTPSPTAAPTAFLTATPTASPTASPTAAPTAFLTATPTASPTVAPEESKSNAVAIVAGVLVGVFAMAGIAILVKRNRSKDESIFVSDSPAAKSQQVANPLFDDKL